MEIAVLSDTHVPEQADALSSRFREYVRDADHVVHAGDFGSEEAFERVRDVNADLTAVYGNADPVDIDLPAVASLTVGGVELVVSHGMVNFVARAVSSSEGVVATREDWLNAVADTARARADTSGTVVGVAGHSHEVENETHEGVRVLNPGSATGVGPADGVATMMTVEVDDGRLDVTVREE